MANSIEESVQEAITEIKTKEWVIDAEVDAAVSEDKPCNTLRKRLNVFHKSGKGYVFSGKELYINKSDFTYKWHYGGSKTEPDPTPFKDMLETKLDNVKTTMGLDWIEIVTVSEVNESAIIEAIKGTTGNNADKYTIKVYKTGEDTIGYKIIEKTTVSS